MITLNQLWVGRSIELKDHLIDRRRYIRKGARRPRRASPGRYHRNAERPFALEPTRPAFKGAGDHGMLLERIVLHDQAEAGVNTGSAAGEEREIRGVKRVTINMLKPHKFILYKSWHQLQSLEST